jgi:hypothetical protein
MTIPISFPDLGRQNVVTGTGAPDPFKQIMMALLQGAQLGQAQSEERGRNSRSSADLALEQKKLDIVLADKKIAAIQAKTEGEAAKNLIPAMIQRGGLQSPQQQGAQQPQQGIGQPMGLPDIGLTASGPTRASQSPQETFNRIVAGLPPEMVGGFMQKYGPMVAQQQAKLDQEAAFDEAEQITTGLLTPKEAQGMRMARVLFQAGAPKELYTSLLPAAQIELAKGAEEVRALGNKRDADKLATGKLADLGLVPKHQGGVGTEYIVKDAAKMYYDYIADVRKDARARTAEQAKVDKAEVVKGLEGSALEIAQQNPDWTGAQIKKALKSSPAYAGLADGLIAKAALEAPKNVRALTAPKNESEARIRVTYGAGRAALMTVNAMDIKGEALGFAARAAQAEGGTGKTLMTAGTGAAIGTPIAGPVGAIAGGLVGAGVGAIAPPVIRGLARMSMSKDQQRLWTAAQTVAAMIYRPETGAQATVGEIRTTMERYIPLTTDSPAAKQIKRVLRQELDKTLADVSGLPRELGQSVIDGLLSKHEQELLKAGVALTPIDDETSATPTAPPYPGYPFVKRP